MSTPNKFLIDNIDITQGAITALEEKIIQDDNGTYIRETQQFIDDTIKKLQTSDDEKKQVAINAFQALKIAIDSYRVFIEERKN